MAFARIFAALIATAATDQATPATPLATASIAADPEGLNPTKPELQKPAKPAKLLNGTDVGAAMDYPEEALRKEEQGTVQVWLLVGIDGRVERCGIEKSSGSVTLDSQTCDLFVARAEFRPAQDRRGRAMPSLITRQLTWKLDQDEPGTSTASRLTLVVGAQTQIRSCKDEEFVNQQWVEGPKSECDRFTANWSSALATAKQKSKVDEAVVVVERGIVSETDKTRLNVGKRTGEVLVWLRSWTVMYAADGSLSRCAIDESFGSLGGADDPCARVPRTLTPQDRRPGGGPTIKRYLSAIYLKDEPQ